VSKFGRVDIMAVEELRRVVCHAGTASR